MKQVFSSFLLFLKKKKKKNTFSSSINFYPFFSFSSFFFLKKYQNSVSTREKFLCEFLHLLMFVNEVNKNINFRRLTKWFVFFPSRGHKARSVRTQRLWRGGEKNVSSAPVEQMFRLTGLKERGRGPGHKGTSLKRGAASRNTNFRPRVDRVLRKKIFISALRRSRTPCSSSIYFIERFKEKRFYCWIGKIGRNFREKVIFKIYELNC